MDQNAQRDDNFVPSLLGISSSDPTATAAAAVDPLTNRLLVNATLSGASDETKITDGTNIVNVLKSDGTAAGQNAALVAGTYVSVPFTTTTAQAVASMDVGNYSWVSVQITSQGGSSTVTFQTSNDNSTWVSQGLTVSTSTTGAVVTSTTSANLYHGPIQGRYFRLNVTGIASGTTAGTVIFATSARVLQSLGVIASQTGTWTVGSNTATGSAVPANAFYIGGNLAGNLTGVTIIAPNDGQAAQNGLYTTSVIELFNGTNFDRHRSIINATNSTGTGIAAVGLTAQLDDTSPTTITENQFGNLRIDTARQLRVNNQQSPDSTLLVPYSVRLTTNTTTTPTSATAYISSITLSSEVAGTTSTVTIQDKQGTPLKLVNGFSTVAVTTTPTVVNFQTPVKMTSGIDIITAGAVAATVDIWINYYQ